MVHPAWETCVSHRIGGIILSQACPVTFVSVKLRTASERKAYGSCPVYSGGNMGLIVAVSARKLKSIVGHKCCHFTDLWAKVLLGTWVGLSWVRSLFVGWLFLVKAASWGPRHTPAVPSRHHRMPGRWAQQTPGSRGFRVTPGAATGSVIQRSIGKMSINRF